MFRPLSTSFARAAFAPSAVSLARPCVSAVCLSSRLYGSAPSTQTYSPFKQSIFPLSPLATFNHHASVQTRNFALRRKPADKPTTQTQTQVADVPEVDPIQQRIQDLEMQKQQLEALRQQQLQQQNPSQQYGIQPQVVQEVTHNQTGRQIDHVTEGVKAHIMKVYATIGSMFGLAGVGSAICLLTPLGAMSPWIPAIASFVPLIWLYMTQHKKENEKLRLGLLSGFGVLSGMAATPLIAMAVAVNPLLILTALGLTGGVFAAMTAMALFMPSKSALRWGAPLFGCMLVLVAASIGAMFVPVTSAFYPILHSVSLYGGLLIFSLYVAFDTQGMIDDYEAGNPDYIQHSLGLFIDAFAIFKRILFLLLNRD
eukprot:TRINITY_DN531_c0_g1_i2.p1 TRINITY_DN531_c0_g1~~TRINITY_DN531_c0_g1_i2.p1  ORF type:complete len:377 (+),score=116.97 TRINITY_DN531_c0_g1_i2:26-1132(+)